MERTEKWGREGEGRKGRGRGRGEGSRREGEADECKQLLEVGVNQVQRAPCYTHQQSLATFVILSPSHSKSLPLQVPPTPGPSHSKPLPLQAPPTPGPSHLVVRGQFCYCQQPELCELSGRQVWQGALQSCVLSHGAVRKDLQKRKVLLVCTIGQLEGKGRGAGRGGEGGSQDI